MCCERLSLKVVEVLNTLIMNLIEVLVQVLSIIFFLIGLGYFSKISGYIPGDANKGIGPLVGKVCLPMLIFRNIAKLDLSSLNFKVIGAVIVVKVLCFCLAAGIAYLNGPKTPAHGDEPSIYGIMTLFSTMSNDLAIGLAVIQAVFPPSTSPIDFEAITFVVVGLQTAIIGVPSFVLLEYGKALRDMAAKEKLNCSVCAKKLSKLVLMNLMQNPVLISTFAGLLYAVAVPPTPGDTSVNQNIPYLLDYMLLSGGSAFGMASLFLGGMAIAGNLKLLQGKKVLVPLLLSLIKVLVALIGYYVAMGIFQGDEYQEMYTQYVFIYSSIPTASSIIVFAQQYDVVVKDTITGATVLALLIWAPLMFITAVLLINTTSVTGGSTSLFALSFTVIGTLNLLVTAAISPDWRQYPKVLVPHLAGAALFFSVSHIGCLSDFTIFTVRKFEFSEYRVVCCNIFRPHVAAPLARVCCSFGIILFVDKGGKILRGPSVLSLSV